MSEDRKFQEADSFDEWFDLNRDLIHDMIRNDAYELMWETWFGGYQHGLKAMSTFWHVPARPFTSPKPVDDQDDSVVN